MGILQAFGKRSANVLMAGSLEQGPDSYPPELLLHSFEISLGETKTEECPSRQKIKSSREPRIHTKHPRLDQLGLGDTGDIANVLQDLQGGKARNRIAKLGRKSPTWKESVIQGTENEVYSISETAGRSVQVGWL